MLVVDQMGASWAEVCPAFQISPDVARVAQFRRDFGICFAKLGLHSPNHVHLDRIRAEVGATSRQSWPSLARVSPVLVKLCRVFFPESDPTLATLS